MRRRCEAIARKVQPRWIPGEGSFWEISTSKDKNIDLRTSLQNVGMPLPVAVLKEKMDSHLPPSLTLPEDVVCAILCLSTTLSLQLTDPRVQCSLFLWNQNTCPGGSVHAQAPHLRNAIRCSLAAGSQVVRHCSFWEQEKRCRMCIALFSSCDSPRDVGGFGVMHAVQDTVLSAAHMHAMTGTG